jgi:hypothetical protein
VNHRTQCTFKPGEDDEFAKNAERAIWSLADKLDTSTPDTEDTWRLGALSRLSLQADSLYNAAASNGQLNSPSYQADQKTLYDSATELVGNDD